MDGPMGEGRQEEEEEEEAPLQRGLPGLESHKGENGPAGDV